MTGRSPFAHRNFRLLLLGQTTSQFGAQVSAVAIPLLAVITLHATPFQMGLINASSTLAFALIGLQAGAWLDRLRRGPVLIASDAFRAALLLSIPVAWWLGVLTIGQLVVVSLLVGAARVFFDVGYSSYLPTVIGRDKVLAGNSALESVRASGQVAGPGVGGWLVAVLGAASVVLIQSVTFLVSALSLLAIRTREPRPVPDPARPPLRRQIGVGVRMVLRSPVLRATAISSAAGNLAFALASAVTFIFFSRTLRLSPTGIGIVLAIGAVTVVAGAALTPRLARRVGSARIVWLSLAVTGPVGLVSPLAQPGPLVVLVVIGTAVGEFGQIIYAISNVSLRQRLCPDELLGRVNATMRFAIMGLFPLGALVGGALGEWIGLRGTLWVSFSIIALSTIPVYRALRAARDVEDLPAWAAPEPSGPVHERP
jgi:MFS family permease